MEVGDWVGGPAVARETEGPRAGREAAMVAMVAAAPALGNRFEPYQAEANDCHRRPTHANPWYRKGNAGWRCLSQTRWRTWPASRSVA